MRPHFFEAEVIRSQFPDNFDRVPALFKAFHCLGPQDVEDAAVDVLDRQPDEVAEVHVVVGHDLVGGALGKRRGSEVQLAQVPLQQQGLVVKLAHLLGEDRLRTALLPLVVPFPRPLSYPIHFLVEQSADDGQLVYHEVLGRWELLGVESEGNLLPTRRCLFVALLG